MSVPPVPPSLRSFTATLISGGVRFVVVGGFAVIANGFVRATKDVDVLIPDDETNDRRCIQALRGLGAARLRDSTAVEDPHLLGVAHLRVIAPGAGVLDLIREGEPPLDFATVAAGALHADLGDGEFSLAGLRSVVAFKRLADRPVDRLDLERLAEIHGELPIDPIPGLDDCD